jgi:hypothetical protein
MATEQTLQRSVQFEREDILRWFTFSSFWGSVFYLLSCVSLATAHREQPLRINTGTAAAGMGLHVGTFVALGSIGSAVAAIKRGKTTTEMARESIASSEGSLNASGMERLKGALGAGAGSTIPFAMSLASLLLAERLTGTPAFPGRDSIRWPQALATMAAGTGLTALAVSQIASWVARDARIGASQG